MLALTLWQPWATLIAEGAKPVENRTWAPPIRIRGQRIAIHAGKKFDQDLRHLCFTEVFADALRECGITHPAQLPTGALLGYVTLKDCKRMAPAADEAKRDPRVTEKERAFGDWSPGRFAWIADGERGLLTKPLPMRGMQGLFNMPPDVLERFALMVAA